MQEQAAIESGRQADNARYDAKAAEQRLEAAECKLQQCHQELQGCQDSLETQQGAILAASRKVQDLQSQAEQVWAVAS